MASLSILRTTLSNDILRDPNNRIRPVDTLDRAINSAYDRMQEDLCDMFNDGEESTTILTTPAVKLYDLTTEFLRIKQVYIDSQELTKITKKEIIWLWDTEASWKPAYYYLRQWKLGLYNIPDSIYAVTVDYTAKLPTITTSQDSLNPSYLDKALVYLAASELFRWVMQIDKAQVREVEYEKSKDRAMLLLIGDENLTR